MESVALPNRVPEFGCAVADYQFALPPELIAQVPAERRDHARLMVLDRSSDHRQHTDVQHLTDHLRPGDLLIVNDTKVIPARLFGCTASGAGIELLLVRPVTESTWICLGKPARRLRPATVLRFADEVRATVIDTHRNGHYRIAFDANAPVCALLERQGEIPLPPYIRRPDGPLPLDRTRYQTIFATHPGAIAAPTAGLHFTDALVSSIGRKGISIAPVTLHVGPGTFLPVRCADFRQHAMEPEWYEIPAATATRIAAAKAAGSRIVAVGTTTTRALESAAAVTGTVQSSTGWADLFITSGHRFHVVDALLTNFHLPGSTLLLLVSAFAGRERILSAYTEAIAQRYRFYSYGDAMLIE